MVENSVQWKTHTQQNNIWIIIFAIQQTKLQQNPHRAMLKFDACKHTNQKHKTQSKLQPTRFWTN